MARSGSVEGRSGSVMRPAPSCLRLVRDEEWLDRFVPFDEWLTGEEPVAVVTAVEDTDVEDVAGEDDGPLPDEAPLFPKRTPPDGAAAAFAPAWPHTLQ